jgi:hypothetical protein
VLHGTAHAAERAYVSLRSGPVEAGADCEGDMTDHPRFEPVRGAPESAYRRYHGAPLVGLVFRLADRWKGRVGSGVHAGALDAGSIEVHERPRVRPLAHRPEPAVDLAASGRLLPDEGFAAEYILNSARTRRLQNGLLIAFVAVLALLATRGIVMPRHMGTQTAGHAGHMSTAANAPRGAAKLRRAEAPTGP